MKLNKFQKVIETCSKMKEVLVFCELIADTETAPPFLKGTWSLAFSFLLFVLTVSRIPYKRERQLAARPDASC